MRRLIPLILCSIALTGCSGKDGSVGPMGPQGTAGPGTITEYYFIVTPTQHSELQSFSCPAIITSNTNPLKSIVNCAISWNYQSNYTDVAYQQLPATLWEASDTETSYTYTYKTGELMLWWRNSGTTIPNGFQLRVAIINR